MSRSISALKPMILITHRELRYREDESTCSIFNVPSKIDERRINKTISTGIYVREREKLKKKSQCLVQYYKSNVRIEKSNRISRLDESEY